MNYNSKGTLKFSFQAELMSRLLNLSDMMIYDLVKKKGTNNSDENAVSVSYSENGTR
jgi:hypothetical protein